MTPPAPTPALARLRAQWPPAGAPRVLVHGGTCGLQAGSPDLLATLHSTLPAATVVESTCDGACWAAPAATVQRDTHQHRFARLDRGVPQELAACLAGECEDEYAGRGERALLARVGRTDGTLGDAIARGAYAAFARASLQTAADVRATIAGAGAAAPGALYREAQARWGALGEGEMLRLAARRAPGAFAARHLLQGDPHRAIEGVAILCRALDRDHAVIEISPDEPLSRATLESALRDATAILDGSALGGRPLTIEAHEASVAAGGGPDDIEAAAALSLAYDSPPPPTRLLSLTGAFARPGVFEVPVDGATTWSGLVAIAGSSPARVPALLVGGPDGSLVEPGAYEDALTADGLRNGGVLALPPGASLDGG